MNVTLVSLSQPPHRLAGTRRALARVAGERLALLQEPLPDERYLHDAMALNHDLLPLADLGMSGSAVIGRESQLPPGGIADLILLDDNGQLCVVEFKKDGNPDTKEVVAQLLGYAAALWGMSLDRFTARVLTPYLAQRKAPEQSLEEFVADAFAPSSDAEQTASAQEIVANLALTLERGTFRLVVAAPTIPLGVESTLGYLNSQGLRMYALEVDYLKGRTKRGQDVEALVPRLSVAPTNPPGRTSGTPTRIDHDQLLGRLEPPLAEIVASTLDRVQEAGATLGWNSYAATIRYQHGRTTRQVGMLATTAAAVTVKAPPDFPPAPFKRAHERLTQQKIGRPLYNGSQIQLDYHQIGPDQLQQLSDILVDLCQDLHDAATHRPAPKRQG
jgi:hypothetical protein